MNNHGYARAVKVLTSPHALALTTGVDAHDPALRLIGQLTTMGAERETTAAIVEALLPEGYAGNTLDEVEGMIEGALKKGFDRPTERRRSDGPPKVSETIIRLVADSGVDLYHDRQHEAFIDLPLKNSGHRSYPVQSDMVSRWIRAAYYAAFKKSLPEASLREAVATLEAKGVFEGTMEDIRLRLGGQVGGIFVDLGTDDGSFAVINSGGYSVEPSAPLRFRRSPGFAPLPMPTAGGGLLALKELLGLDGDNWVLFVAFLLNCLRRSPPYMLLLIEGEQGSGKSILSSAIKRIIDPNEIEKLRLPRSEHDLMIQASEQSLLVYDNASSMKWDMSDALCSLATGSAFSTRKYYTDNESRSFRHARPVIINGIGDFANRPDLLERSMKITLPSMRAGHRRTEDALWAEFERILPGVLGSLYDIVAVALGRLEAVEAPTTIRMADVARWLVAAEPATGFPPGTFVKALEDVQADMLSDRAIHDPLVMAIARVIQESKVSPKRWDGTVGDLHEVLKSIADPFDKRLPPTAAHLSTALRRLRPSMTNLGFIIEFGRKTRLGRPISVSVEGDEVPLITSKTASWPRY